jgi:transposase InsO family protein
MNYSFLIIVDAHTKWPEIIPSKSTIPTTTINILRDIFSRFGVPHILVSDNGSQFKLSEFEKFLKLNGVHHKCSALYHAATNSQAERFVKIMKQSLRAMENESGDVPLKLSRFSIILTNIAIRCIPEKVYNGFKPGTFGLAVSIPNHYAI